MKDRIVAFLLFLGKLAITAAVGECRCTCTFAVHNARGEKVVTNNVIVVLVSVELHNLHLSWYNVNYCTVFIVHVCHTS